MALLASLLTATVAPMTAPMVAPAAPPAAPDRAPKIAPPVKSLRTPLDVTGHCIRKLRNDVTGLLAGGVPEGF